MFEDLVIVELSISFFVKMKKRINNTIFGLFVRSDGHKSMMMMTNLEKKSNSTIFIRNFNRFFFN